MAVAGGYAGGAWMMIEASESSVLKLGGDREVGRRDAAPGRKTQSCQIEGPRVDHHTTFRSSLHLEQLSNRWKKRRTRGTGNWEPGTQRAV